MSNMEFEKVTYAGDVEILKRPLPEGGIPITLDFSEVEADENGKKIVKAGSPISKNGVVANTADVFGILLHDVYEARPQGTILRHAYINTAVAEEHCGVTYADAVKTALTMITFE